MPAGGDAASLALACRPDCGAFAVQRTKACLAATHRRPPQIVASGLAGAPHASEGGRDEAEGGERRRRS